MLIQTEIENNDRTIASVEKSKRAMSDLFFMQGSLQL